MANDLKQQLFNVSSISDRMILKGISLIFKKKCNRYINVSVILFQYWKRERECQKRTQLSNPDDVP